MRPLALRHRVAEPLMRRLVRDDARRSSSRGGIRRRHRRSRSRSPSRQSASTIGGAPASRTETDRRVARRTARSAARERTGRASCSRCSGAVYTDCGTQRCSSARPQAVSPRSNRSSGAAAMTMRYAGIGRDSRHSHSTRSAPRFVVQRRVSRRACRWRRRFGRPARARATSPSPCRSDGRCSESSAARDRASCRRNTSSVRRCRCARSGRPSPRRRSRRKHRTSRRAPRLRGSGMAIERGRPHEMRVARPSTVTPFTARSSRSSTRVSASLCRATVSTATAWITAPVSGRSSVIA